jgi:hypothetical protein
MTNWAMALCLAVGVGDVALQPSYVRLHVAEGRLPRMVQPGGLVNQIQRIQREQCGLANSWYPVSGYTPPSGKPCDDIPSTRW